MRAKHRGGVAARVEGESAVRRHGVAQLPRWRANLEQELDGVRSARSVVAAVVVVALLGLAVAGDPATSTIASAVEGVAAAVVDA
jgi:hypothetical protein